MSEASASSSVVSQEGRSVTPSAPRPATVPPGLQLFSLLPWGVALLTLVLPVAWSGLWTPYELDVAQLARRLAVGLHGADLGDTAPPPTLKELGGGQLPFSLVAVGFQLFGLSDWAGRLPLALVALLGAIALFALVRTLSDRPTAALAAASLCTMPLYFLQARTLLGHGVGMSAVATATAGLALAAFGPSSSVTSRAWSGALSLLGLFAGFASAGLLLGVAVPLLSVGSAWALLRLNAPALHSANNTVAMACLAVGLVCLCGSLWVLWHPTPDAYLRILGTSLEEAKKLRTHDAVLHQLGHGLLPWSALAPFAFAIVLRPPQSEAAGKRALRVTLLCSFLIALAAHAALDTSTAASAFVGTFAVAGLCAMALRDVASGAHRTRLIAAGVCALLLLLVLDLKQQPEQALHAFLVGANSVPESFLRTGKYVLLVVGALGCAGIAVFLGDLLGNRPREFLSSRLHCDLSTLGAASLMAAGLLLSSVYYPRLANDLSPRDAFYEVSRLAAPHQPLAVLGKSAGVAPYYASRPVVEPTSASGALSWLLEGDLNGRRWLIFERRHLAQLNSLFRKQQGPGANLPVISADSSEVMLASNVLEGEENLNPLGQWVSGDPPKPQHPLDVDLEGKLRCVGWSLLDERRQPVVEARVGQRHTLQIYWQVLSNISKTWKTFVHIEGGGQRFNADHDTLAGEYAFRHWRTGDYITDSHAIEFESRFAGKIHQVYFGLFSGNDRLKVTRGKHHENRIDGGQLRIR